MPTDQEGPTTTTLTRGGWLQSLRRSILRSSTRSSGAGTSLPWRATSWCGFDEGGSGSGHRHKRARPMDDCEDESDSVHQHKWACIDDVQQYPKASTRFIPPRAPLTPPHEENTDLSMDKVPFCFSHCLRSLASEVTTDPQCSNRTIHAQTHQRLTSAAHLRTLARTFVALPAYPRRLQHREGRSSCPVATGYRECYLHGPIWRKFSPFQGTGWPCCQSCRIYAPDDGQEDIATPEGGGCGLQEASDSAGIRHSGVPQLERRFASTERPYRSLRPCL